MRNFPNSCLRWAILRKLPGSDHPFLAYACSQIEVGFSETDFFFLYCGVKSVSKQNYHSNLNSNKICFAISIQRRGKVTREVGKKE